MTQGGPGNRRQLVSLVLIGARVRFSRRTLNVARRCDRDYQPHRSCSRDDRSPQRTPGFDTPRWRQHFSTAPILMLTLGVVAGAVLGLKSRTGVWTPERVDDRLVERWARLTGMPLHVVARGMLPPSQPQGTAAELFRSAEPRRLGVFRLP